MIFAKYPDIRMRRNRSSSFIRQLVQETQLQAHNLIFPLFVIDQNNLCEEIKSMPACFRYGIEDAVQKASECYELGISAVALFPCVENHLKSEGAHESFNPKGLIPKLIKRIKQEIPNLGIISDVALDPYTTSGHDGILSSAGDILNDETCFILAQQALSHAEAGADIVAPSDMMDGRIGIIRKHLEDHGFYNTQILSYTAKYASYFYGPFRDAIKTDKNLKKADKKTYQMDPHNQKEAILEAALDTQEGADILMVKPAMMYTDIIKIIKDNLSRPLFAYQVSGEYLMLKSYCDSLKIEEKNAFMEALTCIKRAGSDAIITYYAPQAARWLKDRNPI